MGSGGKNDWQFSNPRIDTDGNSYENLHEAVESTVIAIIMFGCISLHLHGYVDYVILYTTKQSEKRAFVL